MRALRAEVEQWLADQGWEKIGEDAWRHAGQPEYDSPVTFVEAVRVNPGSSGLGFMVHEARCPRCETTETFVLRPAVMASVGASEPRAVWMCLECEEHVQAERHYCWECHEARWFGMRPASHRLTLVRAPGEIPAPRLAWHCAVCGHRL